MNKVTVEQIEKITIDAGVVYVNYGLINERLLAPCRGDNTFNVEAEIREIEANSMKGKTKGMRRKISENASLKVNLMDTSLENLNMAIPGSRIVENKLTNGWNITDVDYIENIVLIGEDMGGGFRKITLYNVLMDESLTFAMTDKDESVIEMTFAAHYDPADDEDKLWDIEDLSTLETI